MKDGHLNKCKDCTKKDSKERYDVKSEDSAWMEKERGRGREKYKRLGYAKKTIRHFIKQANYPGLRGARRYWASRIAIPEGMELHHWNYEKIREVIMMPRNLHHRLHQALTFDIEKGIYSYKDKELDTIDKHLEVVEQFAKNYGYYKEQIQVLSNC